MQKLIAIIFLAILSSQSMAFTQQMGKISEFYVHNDGNIALKLEGGFTAAVQAECPSSNGYAGTTTADEMMKSVILALYLSGKDAKLGIDGCDNGWLKISNVFSY